jgi:5-methylcytosine-specific restriction endonuclease McrA
MFSDATKLAALRHAGGKCQCTRKAHGHLWGQCGAAITPATAEFHHRTAQFVGGGDSVSNCEPLCVRCHRQTASYGRH